MSEVVNELEGLQRHVGEMESLLNHPGWGYLNDQAQAQIDRLQREILFAPCLSVDSTLAQEYKKGQLEGRLALSTIVQTELEVSQERIKLIKESEEYRNATRSNSNADTIYTGHISNPGGGFAP